MIFKSKFFLDLTGSGADGEVTPALVAPVREKPAPKAKAKGSAPSAVVAAPEAVLAPVALAPVVPAPVAPAAVAPEASPAGSLTTAAAIAAELAAAQANRPAPSLATFAPESLTPGGATPRRRRTGGANLAVFKAMARSFVKN
jgi:hypothetical protein